MESGGNNRLFSVLNNQETSKKVADGSLTGKMVFFHKICSHAVECCGC